MEKYIEIINTDRDSIISELEEADTASYKFPGNRYTIYICEDGSVFTEKCAGNENASSDHDDNCYKIASFYRPGYEWTKDAYYTDIDIILDILAEDSSNYYPKEFSAFEAWKKDMENKTGSMPGKTECLNWWKNTETWKGKLETVVEDLVRMTDYQEILNEIIRSFGGKAISLRDFRKLLEIATASNATQEDIDDLGRWFELYGDRCWNGECYDASLPGEPSGRRNLYPVVAETPEGEYAIIKYEFR